MLLPSPHLHHSTRRFPITPQFAHLPGGLTKIVLVLDVVAHHHTVLLVDDDSDVLDALATGLTMNDAVR